MNLISITNSLNVDVMHYRTVNNDIMYPPEGYLHVVQQFSEFTIVLFKHAMLDNAENLTASVY